MTLTQPNSLARRRFLKRAFSAAALVGVPIVGLSQRGEADKLTVTEHDVPLSQWPQTTPALRVGQLSDLHCDCAHALERTGRAVRLLLAQKPQAVFLTGDFISEKAHHWAEPCAEALAPLAHALPGRVFAVLGNHDWWGQGSVRVPRALHRAGIVVLQNKSVPLPGAAGVWVVGLDDRCMGKQDVSEALRGVPADACKLLLIHEPDFADEAPPGFALQFSGHSHAGQIRVPGLPPMHCPRYGQHYPEGLQFGPHHPVYTTRGVGTLGPPVRLFCPPEVTVLTLGPQAA